MTRKLLAIAVAAGMVAGTTAGAFAQGSTASGQTPGHQMQEKGSVKGSAGASGYAPGQMMQEKGSVKGTTGASGYAPGHSTTGAGASVNSNANLKAGGANAKTGISGGAHVK